MVFVTLIEIYIVVYLISFSDAKRAIWRNESRKNVSRSQFGVPFYTQGTARRNRVKF